MSEAESTASRKTQDEIKDEIRRLCSQVEAYARDLGLDVGELLNPEVIGKEKAVEPAVIAALLNGGDPDEPPEDSATARKEFSNRLFKTRLQYLYRTRRLRQTRHGPEPASLKTIADATLISKPQVSQLLEGARGPNNDHADRLERFYGVPTGHTSTTDAQLLIDYLRQILKWDLPRLMVENFSRQAGVVSLSTRSTEPSSDEDGILAALAPALKELMPIIEAHRQSRGQKDER